MDTLIYVCLGALIVLGCVLGFLHDVTAPLPRNPKTHPIFSQRERAEKARQELAAFVEEKRVQDDAFREVQQRIQRLETHTRELREWVEKNRGKPGFNHLDEHA